jgi:hypothetical protein
MFSPLSASESWPMSMCCRFSASLAFPNDRPNCQAAGLSSPFLQTPGVGRRAADRRCFRSSSAGCNYSSLRINIAALRKTQRTGTSDPP